MKLVNSTDKYGVFSIALHWVMAIVIVAMFALGKFMVDLDYYDEWYHLAPWWHKSVGLLLFIFLVIRWFFRIAGSRVAPLSTYAKWETYISKVTHHLFYVLLLIVSLSGYLVATAKGAEVELFSWLDVSSMMTLTEGQADFWAEVHEVSTTAIAILFLLHVSASIKHHFIDKDATLTRMLGR